MGVAFRQDQLDDENTRIRCHGPLSIYKHILDYIESEFLPVTICKDQRKGRQGNRIFLKLNDQMPEFRCIVLCKTHTIIETYYQYAYTMPTITLQG